MARVCKSCGAEINGDAVCPYCGNPVSGFVKGRPSVSRREAPTVSYSTPKRDIEETQTEAHTDPSTQKTSISHIIMIIIGVIVVCVLIHYLFTQI